MEPETVVSLKEYIDARFEALEKATKIALDAQKEMAAIRERFTSLLLTLFTILIGCGTLAVFVVDVIGKHG
jgi:hypothetical protein